MIETGKQSVNLASAGPRVSRIRRDPPAVKQKIVDPAVRDQWAVVVGVVSFALAFVVIIFAFGSTSFRSSQGYTVELTYSD
jgi:hypothetical protein